MAVKILVASPILSFGELIRDTLSSQGDFQVQVCETGNQVLDAMTGGSFDILILDAAIHDQPFQPLVQKIVACVPTQKIAVVPPENRPDHPLLENVPAHGFLFRPFLDPDLINLVQRLAAAAEADREDSEGKWSAASAEGHQQPPWSEDPEVAGMVLSRLLLGSSALAGLIIREGSLYVHSGRISAAASAEVALMLSQVKNEREKDLVRFTFLVADDCEALVYGISLIGGWTLALVYDVSMPLTRVRSQATSLAAQLRDQMPLEGLLAVGSGAAPPTAGEPEDSTAETDPEDSGEVDISAIMQEINASEDLSGDEFLNITALDDELISLINELNPPKEAKKEDEKPSTGENSAAFDEIYSHVVQAPDENPSLSVEEMESAAIETAAADSSAAPQSSRTEDVDGDALTAADGLDEKPALEIAAADINAAEGLASLSAVGSMTVSGSQPPPEEVPDTPDSTLAADTVAEAAHADQLEGQTTESPAAAEIPDFHPVETGEEKNLETPVAGEEEPLVHEVDSAGGEEGDIDLLKTETPAGTEMAAALDVETGGDTGENLMPEAGEKGPAGQEEAISAAAGGEWIPEAGQLGVVADVSSRDAEVTDTQSGQHYTLVFTPRQLGRFYLTGELASFLGALIKSTPVDYPWKLTGVAIRPDHLRLSVEISRLLDPSEIVAFIKDYTGSAVAGRFSGADEPDHQPFWADEHLFMPGNSIPEGGRLKEFLSSAKNPPESQV